MKAPGEAPNPWHRVQASGCAGVSGQRGASRLVQAARHPPQPDPRLSRQVRSGRVWRRCQDGRTDPGVWGAVRRHRASDRHRALHLLHSRSGGRRHGPGCGDRGQLRRVRGLRLPPRPSHRPRPTGSSSTREERWSRCPECSSCGLCWHANGDAPFAW